MNEEERKVAFLKDLKNIIVKHGASLIITRYDGGAYCDDNKNFFPAEEASIHFNE